MNRKILFGCYEIPGYGGANTATYQLFQLMREDKFEAFYLNIIDEQDADYYRYVFGDDYGNPRSLAHVYNCILNGSLYGSHPELTALIRELSPDVLIGVDFIAALLMKQACPEKKLIFLTAGCQQVKDSVIEGRVRDVIAQGTMTERTVAIPDTRCSEEKKAVEVSDLIITHSDMTLSLYRHFFPYYTGKIYPRVIWFGEWIHREASNHAALIRPFSRRDIDALFIASSWGRPEKNYKMVRKIVSRLNGLKIHIVGEVEEKVRGAVHHGLVTDRDKLFGLMGKAKTVVSPSLYDSAPGILFEASAMGCNLIASKNCGNWKICNDQLLVDPFSSDQFSQKILLAVARKFDDNMSAFIDSESYRDLEETLLVV